MRMQEIFANLAISWNSRTFPAREYFLFYSTLSHEKNATKIFDTGFHKDTTSYYYIPPGLCICSSLSLHHQPPRAHEAKSTALERYSAACKLCLKHVKWKVKKWMIWPETRCIQNKMDLVPSKSFLIDCSDPPTHQNSFIKRF